MGEIHILLEHYRSPTERSMRSFSLGNQFPSHLPRLMIVPKDFSVSLSFLTGFKVASSLRCSEYTRSSLT